jgi:class 3 adenylate cyclase/tetratricopeptide (TPR) repeat protein
MDRRQALGAGKDLPDRTQGTALFADISGFTPLTAALVEELGPQRGAEELIRQLNLVYGALIAELHLYRGSVIGFSGDAITCWLDGDDGSRATACALAMQEAMEQFSAVETPSGTIVTLGVKVAAVTGPVRRFLVGDPKIQGLEALAGVTMDRMAAAEKQAERGEVIVGAEVADQLSDQAVIREWREGPDGKRFAIISELLHQVPATPWPDTTAVKDEVAQAWIFPPVYQRLMEGQSEFLAELRPAVALFIKFTGIDYDQDEDAGNKLDTYVRWVQEVVTGYEGYLVDLTVGDKGSYLYAAFGAPIAHEDDPARAVAAALQLSSPPPNLAFIQGVQMGISQGRMRAGATGGPARRTYAVMGNEVNVAARLMGKAESGQILVSGRVAKAAPRFQFQDLGAIPLKGLSQPMPILAALDRKLKAEDGTLKGRALAPIVGRTTEREVLAQRLESLLANKPGGPIIIEGEAGIGKSRLAADLLEKTQVAGITALLGGGQSIEQQTPYRAWRDILTGLLEIGGVTDPIARQGQARDLVQNVAPDQLPRLPLLNDILSLGLPENDLTESLDPALRQQSLFLLVTALLQAKAREQALILVLEDAHWLDSLSWEMAVHLSRALAITGVPFLLVTVTRPLDEHVTASKHLSTLQAMEGSETLVLGALSASDTLALVTFRLGLPEGGLPETVSELVKERAGGNPFFAEELVFTLRDQGLIRVETQDGETRCLVDDALGEATRDLPDTVQGLVLSRIDRLPPEQQLTLKVAAVIGRTFPYTPLQHTLQQHSDIDDLTLKSHLDDLAILDLTPLDTPEPELTYIFKHITTQEVAYQTMLFAQRRQLHRTVAGWYEGTYGETEDELAPYLSLLVHHYHYAEEPGQERHYAKRAGQHAAAQFANAEAVRYLGRALELTDEEDLRERYDLLLSREIVYDLQGNRELQQQDLSTLVSLTEALSDKGRQAEVALRQAYYSEVTSDYPTAIAATETAVAQAQDVRSEAAAYLQWGRTLWLQGEYEPARTQLELALEKAQDGSLDQVKADSLRNLGIVALNQGNYAEAEKYLNQAVSVCQESGYRASESKSLNSLGNVLVEQGSYAEACAHYEQALFVYRETGDRRGEGMVLFNLGATSADQGDYGAAMSYYEQCVLIFREVDDPVMVGYVLNNLGLVYLYLGEYDQGQSSFEQALGIFRQAGDRRVEGVVLCSFSLILHQMGRDDVARDHSQQALSIAQQVGDQATEAEALTNLGHALVELGDLDGATDTYQRGLSLRRELGEDNMATEPLAGLARLALAQKNLLLALAHVEEILDHLQEGSLEGAYEPLRIYLTCYQVLRANQDPCASEILTTAVEMLLERAARIEDEETRRSFLENVATHREIMSYH